MEPDPYTPEPCGTNGCPGVALAHYGLCVACAPTPRPAHMPPPVCRVHGCAEPAFYGDGFCLADGLRYLDWRSMRDEFERADLDGTGYAPYAELSDAPQLAAALDAVHRFLTPEPFR